MAGQAAVAAEREAVPQPGRDEGQDLAPLLELVVDIAVYEVEGRGLRVEGGLGWRDHQRCDSSTRGPQ